MNRFAVAILTCSDRCSRGETTDTSGPALVRMVESQLDASVVATACVPDDADAIALQIRSWAIDAPKPDLILSTGGTGLSPRDVTPEATASVLERRHPGLLELARMRCLPKTARAYLSRGEAGTIGQTLVINLPGSERGATETLAAVIDLLPHALEILRGEVQDDGRPGAKVAGGKVVEHEDLLRPPASGDHPAAPLLSMAIMLSPVTIESIEARHAAGRVLAEKVYSDRDSPACDVSAMDGYALRHADLTGGPLPLSPTPARIGRPPVVCPEGHATYIVTGAPIPEGADTVVRQEDVVESVGRITLRTDVRIELGTAVRERGENMRKGSAAIDSGFPLTQASLATCATFGLDRVNVFRRVRVAMIVSGDEVLPPSQQPEPWQVRDSNGAGLRALLAGIPWVEQCEQQHVPDELEPTVAAIERALADADCVILTGGVSMGDRDYVQIAVERVGAQVQFHGLPIRPGRPMLGAISPGGKAVLGLPGNPVSVLVTARRFGMIVLRRLAGLSEIDPPAFEVSVKKGSAEPHPTLWLYKPACIVGPSLVNVFSSKSSGDIAAAGRGDGIVEIPTHSLPGQRYAYYPWSP